MENSEQNIMYASAGAEESWELARKEVTCFQGGKIAQKISRNFTQEGGSRIWSEMIETVGI